MDSSKAKKAKSTAKKAKARRSAGSQESMENQMLMQAAMQGSGINPEVQAPVAAMQNQTQAVNPYGRMGSVAPNLYNPGNVVTNY